MQNKLIFLRHVPGSYQEALEGGFGGREVDMRAQACTTMCLCVVEWLGVKESNKYLITKGKD